jgi:hemolysin III
MSQYSPGHELANSIIHGIAALLSAAGLTVMVVFAALNGDAWHIVSCSIYGATMVLLYTASTLYHSFQRPRVKEVFHVIDHAAIYLLIAGTYTPFMLVTLRGPWGWSIFGSIWGLTALGIGLKIFFTGRFRLVSTGIYLLMGWLVVIAIKPLLGALPRPAILLLLTGGLLYTLGVIFYICRRIPFHHAIWHAFVFAASAFHFFAIMLYVIPWA